MRQDLVVKQQKISQVGELQALLAEFDSGIQVIEGQVGLLEKDFLVLKEKESQAAVFMESLSCIESQSAELGFVLGQERDFISSIDKLLGDAEKVLPTSGVCPLCGQTVTAECSKKILDNLRSKYAHP